jgi:hypothetical protein
MSQRGPASGIVRPASGPAQSRHPSGAIASALRAAFQDPPHARSVVPLRPAMVFSLRQKAVKTLIVLTTICA